MDANTTVKAYVRDVVERLPRGQRVDVSLELEALIREELEAVGSGESGDTSPEDVLSFLDRFGSPVEVASRYHSSRAVISPVDTRSFTVAAITGIVMIAGIARVAPPEDGFVGLAVLAWLGLLVCFFAVKSWVAELRPGASSWRPTDRDRMSRVQGALLVGVILLGIVTYGAPEWVYSGLSGGRQLSSWLRYDTDFATQRMPWILGLWSAQALLFGIITIRGKWNPTLRLCDTVLQVAVAVVLVWCAWAGRLFQQPGPDEAARTLLGIAVVCIAVHLAHRWYREPGLVGARHTSFTGRPDST